MNILNDILGSLASIVVISDFVYKIKKHYDKKN